MELKFQSYRKDSPLVTCRSYRKSADHHRISVFAARISETVRAFWWHRWPRRHGTRMVRILDRRCFRDGRWRAHNLGAVYATRCVPVVRRNGGSILSPAFSTRLLADSERRRTTNFVLLHLPLLVRGWTGSNQSRSGGETQTIARSKTSSTYAPLQSTSSYHVQEHITVPRRKRSRNSIPAL